MTYEEVVENIGTIAQSGSQDFLQKLQEHKDDDDAVDFIGQFGLPTFMIVYLIVFDRPKQDKRMNELIESSCKRDTESVKDLKKSISNLIDVVSGTLIQMREDIGMHIRSDDENYQRSLELLKQQNRKFALG